MKRKLKKLAGITLVELVIVLAIFSGIAVGALAMVRPILLVYNRAAAHEKAVASADTLARYIQDNLKCAENILIYKNHGIKDIDVLIGCPFEMCRMGKMVRVQQAEMGKSIYNADKVKYESNGDHFHNNADFKWKEDTDTQKWCPAGTEDYHQWINPISYYAKTYYEDSCFNSNYTEGTDYAGQLASFLPKTQGKQLKEYAKQLNELAEGSVEYADIHAKYVKIVDDYTKELFENRIIYIMEITDTSEVNIYGFPLKDDAKDVAHIGITNCFNGADNEKIIRTSLKLNTDDGIKIKGISAGNTAKDGMRFDLDVAYKGATDTLHFDYNFSVSFMNPANRPSYVVKEIVYSDAVKSYGYFDWADKHFSWPDLKGNESKCTGRLDEGTVGEQYYCPTSDQIYKKDSEGNILLDDNGNKVYKDPEDSDYVSPGYTYIVYSLPEIAP